MNGQKIIVARLWQKYEGRFPALPRVLLRFNRDGFSTVCIYLEKKSDKPNYYQEQGCKVEFLSTKSNTVFFNPILVWKLVKVLKANKVDILHCHRHKATVYGLIAAKLAGIPIVFSHVHGLNRTRNVLRRLENRLIFTKVNRVLTIGEAVSNDVLESNPTIAPEKVISIGHGIEFQKYAEANITKAQARGLIGIPLTAFLFGTVGRLVPTKGQSDLIDAFAKVRAVLPDAHLVLVGDGKLENELKQKAIELGCQNSITFTGHRTDLPKVLRAFDCFVFPSHAEGVGCALLEAMAASLPCIGSSVGGIPEVLNSNKVGTLVPAHDADALARAMIDYAKISEQQRAEIGANAKERVRQFYSDEIVLDKLEKVYKSEINKIKPPRGC